MFDALCGRCQVIGKVRNVCISLVLVACMNMRLDDFIVPKWESLILHRFYTCFWVSQRGVAPKHLQTYAQIAHGFLCPSIGRSELTFSNVLGPSDALALRLCSEIVQGRVRFDLLRMVKGGVLGPGRGTFEEGYKDLYCWYSMLVTWYLTLDTWYLILETDTYTWYLYLYTWYLILETCTYT